MVSTPTVLVLGAGSSMPYGFPSGPALVDIITGALVRTGGDTFDEHWADMMKQFKVDHHDLYTFSKALHLSQRNSIDAFLERRPEFISIGKIAIALALIPYESRNAIVTPPMPGQAWYRYLWNEVLWSRTFDEFANNQLTIVTFNYDRSLDDFLFTVLHFGDNRTVEECAVMVNQVPIIHVHGSLGPLPWQRANPDETRPYTPEANFLTTRLAAESIAVLSEPDSDRVQYEEAANAIAQADRIYFLGLGYHDDMLQRLRVASLKGRTMIGTGVALPKQRAAFVKDHYGIEVTEYDTLTLLKDLAQFR